jgi:hypothetical protein
MQLIFEYSRLSPYVVALATCETSFGEALHQQILDNPVKITSNPVLNKELPQRCTYRGKKALVIEFHIQETDIPTINLTLSALVNNKLNEFGGN